MRLLPVGGGRGGATGDTGRSSEGEGGPGEDELKDWFGL